MSASFAFREESLLRRWAIFPPRGNRRPSPFARHLCYEAQVAGVESWLTSNWFSLLQSLGIIFGLVFTAVSVRRDTAARQASDLLSLSERHQELWSELYKRAELQRIRGEEADLVASPVTPAEREFLRLVFVHFYAGWLLAKRGSLVRMAAVREDTRNFFSLPIPRAVWKETHAGMDPKFIAFVNSCTNS